VIQHGVDEALLSHGGTRGAGAKLEANASAIVSGTLFMDVDRRSLLAISLATGTLTGPRPEPIGPMVGSTSMGSITALGVNAVYLGVQPGSPDDQTQVLQRAIERASGAGVPLVLPPGVYRAGRLELPTGTHLIGMRGATRLILAQDGPLASTNDADYLTLSGLSFEGNGSLLPDQHGLLHLRRGRRIRIEHCEVIAAGGHGILLEQIEGEIAGNSIVGPSGAAILSRDARGLVIAGNLVQSAGNNGVLVWRSQSGDDGTLVADNRIEAVDAQAGGSGQNGNAINVFQAGNVIVRGNRIRSAAFSAIRGHSASNLQIVNNCCSDLGEVALYAAFGFEGAVIANNTIDGAAVGISVANFDHGGRLAVVQGNLVRHLRPKRRAGANPDDLAGVGITVEADTTVTGNVVEQAAHIGIGVGWGQSLRDVTVIGNIIRAARMGIAVSVVPGAGSALITNNLIADAPLGAVVGVAWKQPVTEDLTRGGADRFAQLTIGGNQTR
jgi:uncharacterized secreted repeat protein (TIGR03808 family)